MLVTGAVLATLSPALTTTASAAAPSYLYLSSHIQTIKTSTGKSLHLSIGANKTTTSGNTDPAGLTVSLSTSSTFGVGETHTWSFSIPRAAFGYTAGTGKAVLSTGTHMGPFGALKLTFHKTSQSKHTCGESGSLVTIRGTLGGTVNFISGLTPWGKFKRTGYSFATPNIVSINTGPCTEKTVTPTCATSVSWSAPTSETSPSISGSRFTVGSSSTSTMSAYRRVALAHPAGASRSDNLTKAEPAPTIKNGSLVVTTKSGSGISGHASIGPGTTSTNPGTTCKQNGTNHTSVTTYHFSAAWSSSPKLIFDFKAIKDIVAPAAGSTAFWSQTKVT